MNDFATDPIWISLYMTKISFSFLSVYSAYVLPSSWMAAVATLWPLPRISNLDRTLPVDSVLKEIQAQGTFF